MGKKLSTLTAGIVTAAISATAMAPSAFAYYGQDNKIIITKPTNGTVEATPTYNSRSNIPGTATLTITPAEDYVCNSVTATYETRLVNPGTHNIDVTCDNPNFELPAIDLGLVYSFPDVNINVNFARKVYAINVDVAEEGTGTAEANPMISISGETITLTATPAENYQFVEWTGDVEVSADAIATFEMPKSDVDLTAVFEKYAIIDGAEGNWTAGSEEGLAITGNGYFTSFVAAYVDGNKLGEANYTAEAGSTKVTLAPAFLATLANGSHTFSMEWGNGTAETTFTILEAKEEPKEEEPEEEPKEEKEEEVKVAPDTGITSATILFAVAAILIAGGALVARKSNTEA